MLKKNFFVSKMLSLFEYLEVIIAFAGAQFPLVIYYNILSIIFFILLYTGSESIRPYITIHNAITSKPLIGQQQNIIMDIYTNSLVFSSSPFR